MKSYNKILIFFILIILRTTTYSQIILIEGSPCSGKTTVATLLFERLLNSELISVDDYVEGQYVNEEKLRKTMNERLAENITVICDTNGNLKYFKKLFPSIDIFSVLLFCPPLEIIKRTINGNRIDIGNQIDPERNPTEIRNLPEVINYFTEKYEITRERNIASLSTLSSRDIKNIIKIWGNDPIESNGVYRTTIALAKWAFPNRSKARIFIQPKFKLTDLIINTVKYNPNRCANIIKKYYAEWLNPAIYDRQHRFT